MNSIRIWSINIVAVSFIACILRMLLPKDSLKGGVVLGINLLTLLVIISPLAKNSMAVPTFQFSSVEMVDFQVEDYAIQLTTEITEKNIQNKLEELGIKPGVAVIDISMKTQPTSEISVSILIPAEYSDIRGEVQKEVTDLLELPVIVGIIEKEAE